MDLIKTHKKYSLILNNFLETNTMLTIKTKIVWFE